MTVGNVFYPFGVPPSSDGESFELAAETLEPKGADTDEAKSDENDPSAFDENDPNFQRDWVQAERKRILARQIAEKAESQRLWTPPPMPASLFDELAEDISPIDWVIKDLAPAGVAQVNAQAKGGKTTLLLNAMKSLATGEKFLGRFDVVTDSDERISYLNMELPKRQMRQWVREMNFSDDAAKRISMYHALDQGFRVLDFRNDNAVTWLIRWLTDNGTTILFADPLAKLYNPARWGNGSDPNAAYTAWFAVLEDIIREARLRLVFIAHHTGFSEDAANRSRGASAMMDNPTVNMTYRHNGDHADKPTGPQRYLKAFGRDVDVDEFEISYVERTRRLYASGEGSRSDAAEKRWALECYDALVAATGKGVPELNASDLASACGIAPTSKRSDDFRRGRDVAVREKWLALRVSGTAKFYSLGTEIPLTRSANVISMSNPKRGRP
ncbi:AAA family ATPase [Mycolicibacterium elephantis]|uniref:AAA family ATPase n=1 Tax=Mycolicibacterium elephantis TaxID=81858 RepID=UPI000B1D6380|nr:AAA family ATPase [Mycolicibacterium elephantis]